MDDEKKKIMEPYYYMDGFAGIFYNANPENVNGFLNRIEDPLTKHELGYTLLHGAARWTEFSWVITALLKLKIDVNLPDVYGHTPLHWAAWGNEWVDHREKDSIVKFLLDNGAKLVSEYKNGHEPLHGYTPIHLAAINNRNEFIMQSLVDADGAKKHLLGDSGNEIVDLAKKYNKCCGVALVLEKAIKKAKTSNP